MALPATPQSSATLAFLNEAIMQPPKPASVAASMMVWAAMPSSHAENLSPKERLASRSMMM